MGTLRDSSALAEHQLWAAVRLEEILDRYGGAILADEPGLGKSFVAAEVARRETSHGSGIEAVVPASLVAQWNDTFLRFGVPATVMTHAALLSGKATPAGMRLLVVDEAHAFRNCHTQRFAALARRSVGSKLLLVTATPVCNSARDLQSLLRLIVADDALLRRGVPSIDVALARRDRAALDIIMAELVIRRDRSVLPPQLAFGELDRRVILTADASDEASTLIRALRFPLVSGAPLVRDFLVRRLESSEAALLESLRRQRRFYERALECLAAGRALPKHEYRRAFGHEEDAAAFQTVLFWELFVDAGSAADREEITSTMRALDHVIGVVERLPRAKERALVELCVSITEPALIFTGWTATARSLAEALGVIRRTVVVSGRERSNASAIECFRRGAADILVSTDVGAEGLNLQRAGVVVHYDLPWNPVKIDQRNGRAHRIGQRRESVRAIYFLPGRRGNHVLRNVAAKNRTRRELLRSSDLAAEADHVVPTIRPRVTADAAVVGLIAAAACAGWSAPPWVERRHRAGAELLIQEVACGPIDAECLRRLEEALGQERRSAAPPARFTPL